LDDIVHPNFSIYPNPAEDYVQIALNKEGPESISISNMMGQVVIHGTLTAQSSRVDLSKLASGMYFIRIGSVSEAIIKQ